MTSKSIILPLVGAALLSITPAIGQTQATKQAEPKQETAPSRVVLHSMRAKRLRAKHVNGTAMTKVVEKQAKGTAAKSTKRRVTPSKKMVRKVSSKTTKGNATSSKLMRRTNHASKKHQAVKKSSTKS